MCVDLVKKKFWQFAWGHGLKFPQARLKAVPLKYVLICADALYIWQIVLYQQVKQQLGWCCLECPILKEVLWMTTVIQTAMVNDSGNPLVPPIRDMPALVWVSWMRSAFNVTTALLALKMVGCAIQLLQRCMIYSNLSFYPEGHYCNLKLKPCQKTTSNASLQMLP